MLVRLVEHCGPLATLRTQFKAARHMVSLAPQQIATSRMIVRVVDKLSVADQSATLRTQFKAAGHMRSHVSGNCRLDVVRAFG